MKLFKRLLFTSMVVFISIQCIRPARNQSGLVSAFDITKTLDVPANVLITFQKACYDCHSNNTRYPWYMNVQPMGWLITSHIKNGKENLNFSEFGSYSRRKQANKLRAIAKNISEGSMPISSYTIMHIDAKLNKESKESIKEWVTKTRDSLLATN